MHADRQIPGWFPEVNRNHLIHLMRKHNVKVVLEIGAFLGKSTVFFAERVARVYSIDYFRVGCLKSPGERQAAKDLSLPQEFEAIFWDNLREVQRNHLFAVPMADVITGSPDGLPAELDVDCMDVDCPDLLYIDGDHSYEGVLKDLDTYAHLARKIICGDDYGVAEGVTQAVNERFRGSGIAVNTAPPFWWVEVEKP